MQQLISTTSPRRIFLSRPWRPRSRRGLAFGIPKDKSADQAHARSCLHVQGSPLQVSLALPRPLRHVFACRAACCAPGGGVSLDTQELKNSRTGFTREEMRQSSTASTAKPKQGVLHIATPLFHSTTKFAFLVHWQCIRYFAFLEHECPWQHTCAGCLLSSSAKCLRSKQRENRRSSSPTTFPRRLSSRRCLGQPKARVEYRGPTHTYFAVSAIGQTLVRVPQSTAD